MLKKEKGGTSAHKTIPKDKIASEQYKPIPANSFIHELIYNPNFRKDHCLDCKNHKPFYICQKCKAEIHDGFVDVTISGNNAGRFALDGQK